MLSSRKNFLLSIMLLTFTFGLLVIHISFELKQSDISDINLLKHLDTGDASVSEITLPSQVKTPWLVYRKNLNQLMLIKIDEENGLITFLDGYRQKMLSKGYHPLTEKYQLFKSRLDVLNTNCDKLNISGIQLMDIKSLARIYFNDSYEALHCVVPKASSRGWVHKFVNMQNASRTIIPEANPEERYSFSLGTHLTPYLLTAQRLHTYTKFLVTRHPFRRLLSGFNDKFDHHVMYVDGMNKVYIKKLYLSGLPESESDFIEQMNSTYSYLDESAKNDTIFQYRRLRDPYLKKITFMEFLQYIIVIWEETGSTDLLDDHWKPISRLCSPCAFSYDILIEHENATEESNLVMDYLTSNNDLNHMIKFDSFVTNTKINICNTAFNAIPLEMRKKLYEIYKADFLLFGYRTNDDDIC